MSPKKGLVLGAGGARGFAYLGVLQVLEEEKIGMDIAVKNRSPLHIARNMGAEKVLAVDVKREFMTKPSSAMDILLQCPLPWCRLTNSDIYWTCWNF